MVEIAESRQSGSPLRTPVGPIIRWGIWGTGHIANAVAQDFRFVKGATPLAVASRTPERAKLFAAAHGIPRSYGSLTALLADGEIDAVYVATPNHRHLEDCLASIHAGKAVLCEKPFALNYEQAIQIAGAARQRQVFCMEAMWTRFIPAIVEAKRWVDSGTIGPIRLVQGNFAYPAARGAEPNLFDPACGGGALLDRGVYLISLAQFFLGAPQSVNGIADMGPTGVDEQSCYQLGFSNGALANLASSLRVRGSNDFVLFGERGTLRLREPFYSPDCVVLQLLPPPELAAKSSSENRPAGARRILKAARSVPGALLLKRRLSPLLNLLTGARSKVFPFAGNGYQFELAEVGNCLRLRRTESAMMTLENSLEVMRSLDGLRRQWNLRYPQELPGHLN